MDPGKADTANEDASSSTSDAVGALLHGLGAGVKALSSLVFFLAMTTLSLLFLLADGPKIRAWGERHLGVPQPVARMISHHGIESLRGYFFGVTLVGAFNGVVVLVGALLLGVPLAGTIAAVTFLASYVPYLGAWTAGAFAVLVTLGSAGTEAAAGMIVVQLLANSVLQQMVQPFAMGAALGIHPACRAHPHDRRGRPVRRGGPDPRRPRRGRGGPDLGGSRPCQSEGRGRRRSPPECRDANASGNTLVGITAARDRG